MDIEIEGTDRRAIVGTMAFSLDGINYEADLSIEDAAALRRLLTGYISAARRIDGGVIPASKEPKRCTAGHWTTSRIRSWAVDSGFQIASHGPIPDRILEAFYATNPARSA